jgi:hypothetical protein
MTDLLELALDDLVPSFAQDPPDWSDVLARSARKARRRRTGLDLQRHPRRAVAIAVALLLIVLLATPAFGVQGYVLHLLGRTDVSFGNSPSAPNVVKKQFLDLPLGAPLPFSPQVKAGQARVVATFSIAGHPRKLFVAPTRQGGYCYTFERSFGGCRAKAAERDLGERGQFGVTWTGAAPKLRLNESIVTRIGGDVTAPSAARITARYADGITADVPFVWVSRPIAAGFFSYDIPRAHWNLRGRLLWVTLTAKDGKRLGRQAFPYTAHPVTPRIPPSHAIRPKPRVLPTAPPVSPTAPTQSGSADGFDVVVGHNGAVQFVQTGRTPILTELQGKSVGYACFRLTREFGIFTVRAVGYAGRLAPRVGLSLNGVATPVDGCELQASVGRTWPDRLHSRAAVEIPLTAKGRAYFADRRAARDLALFVRSRRMHDLRAEPARQARAGIFQAYGKELARSPIRISVVDAMTLRFVERSGTGRLFTVTVHGGRITKEDLEPYAFVF